MTAEQHAQQETFRHRKTKGSRSIARGKKGPDTIIRKTVPLRSFTELLKYVVISSHILN